MGRTVAPGADDDLGSAAGQHPPDERLAVGMGVARVHVLPPALGAGGHPPQRSLLVDDVDGEPVGEGGDDHVDEPDHRLVVGLEGGGQDVTGPGQDGHVLAGVLGPQAAPALGLVESGPLDRGGGAVGHQLEQLEVASENRCRTRVPTWTTPMTWPPTSSGAATRDDTRWRSSGAVSAASATSLTMTAWARDATSPTTPSPTRTSRPSVDPGVEPVRGPDREARAVGGHEEDGGHVPAHHPPGPGQQLVEQFVEGRKDRPGSVTDWMERRATPASWSPRPDPALGHPPEDQDDDDHDGAGEDEQPRQGAIDGQEVEDDDREQGPRHHQGGLAQEGVAAEGLVQEPVGLGPVVVGDDGGGIGGGRVPAGGAHLLFTSSEHTWPGAPRSVTSGGSLGQEPTPGLPARPGPGAPRQPSGSPALPTGRRRGRPGGGRRLRSTSDGAQR